MQGHISTYTGRDPGLEKAEENRGSPGHFLGLVTSRGGVNARVAGPSALEGTQMMEWEVGLLSNTAFQHMILLPSE